MLPGQHRTFCHTVLRIHSPTSTERKFGSEFLGSDKNRGVPTVLPKGKPGSPGIDRSSKCSFPGTGSNPALFLLNFRSPHRVRSNDSERLMEHLLWTAAGRQHAFQ